MKKRELQTYLTKKREDIAKELKALVVEFSKARLNIMSGREKILKKAKNISKKISQLKTMLKIVDINKVSETEENK